MLSRKRKFTKLDFTNLKIKKTQKQTSPIGSFVLVLDGGDKKTIVIKKTIFKQSTDRNFYKRLFYNIIKADERLKQKSFIFYPNKKFTKEELTDTLKNL